MFDYDDTMLDNLQFVATFRDLKLETLTEHGVMYFNDVQTVKSFLKRHTWLIDSFEVLYQKEKQQMIGFPLIPSLFHDGSMYMVVSNLNKPKLKYKNVMLSSDDAVKLLGVGQINYSNKSVYICEGVYDFMRLKEAGAENVIALLGTRLLDEVKQLLEDFDTIYLILDSDSAGEKSIPFIARQLNHKSLFIREPNFGSEEEYKDVDEFLKHHELSEIKFYN